MTFIIIFLGLLIERFFDFSHLRAWKWFKFYQNLIVHNATIKSPFITLALVTLPLLLILFLLQLVIEPILFGFLGLIGQLIILLYCFGPQNLWADTFACMNVLSQRDSQLSTEKLKTTFGILENGDQSLSLQEQFVNHIFIAGNERIFAVLFWFLVMGPLGALFYRLISLMARENVNENFSEYALTASYVQSLLDWVPVRLFTGFFALGGHFVQVFACWRKKVMHGFDANDQLLIECGVAALGKEEMASLAQNMDMEKNAISLLDRSLIIGLILIAIFILL